ncbi:solute carrier family 25 member 44 [Schistocerca americana]|uniref:solute carrier family 25 member 44 n=1 Tax=Schistocerca americana TaxID=7009 RepID=UPI001F502465|nr:solute carrier family 25 member 44 [Schistocerca americana]XP_047115176.1 solute carrier family 25 member 44 [Schistocerca piceifrons]XP_049812596.1 solute carrier family 25 member 44 [Schistocerca nitens]XP_049960809.1 solute carrier family 25 member 44 [Schistocerca serialis cubense]
MKTDRRKMVSMESQQFIRTIEWEMMDKKKFVPLSMLSSFSIRCFLYPLTVIKTRLQVQRHDQMYTGLFDAWTKIYRHEGIAGLYRGFWVSSFQIVSGVFYISTYEGMRHFLSRCEVDSRVKALVAGGCASLVGQTIIVPFDVLSQHLMVLGIVSGNTKKEMLLNPLGISLKPGRSRLEVTIDIVRQVYIQDGFKGFYRGYVASLFTYVPNSAMWWGFYHFYQDKLHSVFPAWVSHLFIQCVSGTLGGFTTTLLTNPLDIVRARLQVQRIDSIQQTFSILWAEERLRIFTKGLSARLVQSACFSFAIILGYESIKRMSINEEYKKHIRW